jgi:predicted ArsR family transcriptional regulator
MTLATALAIGAPVLKVRYVVKARITSDRENNLSGVCRQVRARLAAIAADPNGELADDVPGSPVVTPSGRRPRRPTPRQARMRAARKQDEFTEFPELFTWRDGALHWINGVLVDNDATAATSEEGKPAVLPEYDRLEALLIDGTVGGVSSSGLDRIWRSPARFAALIEYKIPGRQVLVSTEQDGNWDLSQPTTQIILGILTGIARLEVQRTRQRVDNSAADYAMRGRGHGKAAFGMTDMHLEPGPDGKVTGMHAPQLSESGACPACQGRKTGEWRTFIYVPDEAEGLQDAMAFSLGAPDGWADGLTGLRARAVMLDMIGERALAGDPGLEPRRAYAILRMLDERGLMTREEQTWAQAGGTSLDFVLTNPTYTGKRPWTKDGKGRRRPPEGEGTVLADADWPALWSPRTLAAYERVSSSEKIPVTFTRADGTVVTQLRKRNQNTQPGKASAQHLGTGSVQCWCGEPAYVQHNRSRPRYECQLISKGLAGRGNRHAVRDAQAVHDEMERMVKLWMSEDGLYDQSRAAAAGSEELQAELDAKTKDRDEEIRVCRLGDMTDEEIRRRVAPLTAEIRDLEARIRSAVVHDQLARVTARGSAFCRQWDDELTSDEIEEAIRPFTQDQKAEIVSVLVNRVVLHKPPLRGGKESDSRFIVVYPGAWAEGLADPSLAEPDGLPGDAEALSSRGRVRAALGSLAGGQDASVADIAASTGLPGYTVKVALGKLLAAGEAAREWHGEAGGGRGAGSYQWRATAPGEPPAPVGKGASHDQVLAWLRERPAGQLSDAETIAAALGMPGETVRAALRKLRAAGSAEREVPPGDGGMGRRPYGWRAAALA